MMGQCIGGRRNTRGRSRIARGCAIVVAAAVGLACAAPAEAVQDAAVHGLANGCYTVAGPQGSIAAKGDGWGLAATGTPFVLKPVTLGRFMLFGPDASFLAVSGGAVTRTKTPGPPVDFTLDHVGDGITLKSTEGGGGLASGPDGLGLGTATAFRFVPASGCTTFPEAELDLQGPVHRGRTAYGETKGFIDAHMHMMAYDFLGGEVHCGKPWNPYGVTVALKGCDPTEVSSSVVEGLFTTPEKVAADPVGWPTFKDWPKYDAITHEQSYYKWLERAWRGGQRIFVNLYVENHALCTLYPHKKAGYDCNEMDSVRRQAKDLRDLQDYIDAQSGGPGRGWFRIVADPFEARRVVNAGKLAVIPGIEVSDLFDCGLRNGRTDCTPDDVDARLMEAYNDLGVRDMELINKFNNGFGGVAGDAGPAGVLINGANYLETGSFWDMKPCTSGDAEASDRQQYGLPAAFSPVAAFLPAGATPVYTDGPQCNTLGLSGLGEHLVNAMMDRGMLVDPDHLSVLARDQLLDLAERRRYSGVVSSHSWSTQDAYPRIYELGGFVAPYAGASATFLEQYKRLKSEADPRFYWGLGWGADMNGFGAQGPPREGANPVQYPFKSWDGKVTFDRQSTGSRIFDINTDGVAHYGMYPDWVEDLRRQDGDQVVKDLVRGPEAYLQTWERAVGVTASNLCRARRAPLRPTGLGAVRLDTSAEEVLRGAGQPKTRVARTWRYCVRGGGSVRAVYTRAGRTGLVVSTARGHRAGGVHPGSRAGLIRGGRTLRKGLVTVPAGRGRRSVFAVRGGRVRAVAVASAAVARRPKELLRELRLAGLRPAR